nr:probable disease resistance protein At5g66900 [Malus domestica]
MGGVGELFASAAVGALFTVLYEVVKDVEDKTMMFRELLGDLDSTLEGLKPLIKDIAKYKEVLDQSNKEQPALSGGAAIGTSFNVLDDVLDELITKNVIFKPLLKGIKSRLDSLAPWLKYIEKSYKKLDLSDKELVNLEVHLEEGVELVQKCKKVRWWSMYKRYKYANRLIDWDGSLQRFLEILNVQGIRDVKESTVSVRNMEKLISRIESNMGIHLAVSRETFGSVPELPRVTVGLDEPLRDLKEMLLKDDVSMLVLTATGGWGKTTLATKFCQDEEVKDKFKENIFFVTVSVHPNSDVEKLYQRMKSQEAGQDPLLLVLDDVWSNSVLQKFVELKLRNYKILVTSRSEFPGFGTPYKLKPLNYKDSMTLLRHSAALGDSLSVPEDLLREILKHCKGVPLAITVTGNSLSGQAAESWLSRLEDWRRDSILDYETKLLLCLKSSIDALGDKEAIIRECFMDLVSFPEDQRISAAAFIDMWSELYMLDGDFRSIKNLHELARKGLANLVITRNENMAILDNYYSEHFVRQHDMLRDLGIYIAKLDPIEDRKRLIVVSGRNQPKWLREQKSQPINARLLSISSDGTYPTQWQSVHLPQVEVLVLNFKTENNALPEFVQKIDKLKVLIVTNYGLSPTELSNF